MLYISHYFSERCSWRLWTLIHAILNLFLYNLFLHPLSHKKSYYQGILNIYNKLIVCLLYARLDAENGEGDSIPCHAISACWRTEHSARLAYTSTNMPRVSNLNDSKEEMVNIIRHFNCFPWSLSHLIRGFNAFYINSGFQQMGKTDPTIPLLTE